MESSKRYHPALVTMHWLMALLVFANLYLGIVVFENRGGGGPGNFQANNSLVMVHMIVGITIIVLLILRFILRVSTNRPVDATTGNKFFDSLAKFVH
jgi:cytochrome b561